VNNFSKKPLDFWAFVCYIITMKENMKNSLTATGAAKPLPSSPLWNEWAANNPTPEAKALAAFDPSDTLMASIKAITTGAQPVNNFYQESH